MSQIKFCTPSNPYTTERDLTEPGQSWEHEDAHEVDNSQRSEGDGVETVKVHCNTCGLEWREELPQ